MSDEERATEIWESLLHVKGRDEALTLIKAALSAVRAEEREACAKMEAQKSPTESAKDGGA